MAGRRGVRKPFDWAAMQAYIDEGHGFVHCRTRFGIAHATWIKAIAAGDIRIDTSGKPYTDARKRYDWAAIRAVYESGVTYRECARQFGFTSATWSKAVRRGDIEPRPKRHPLHFVLRYSRRHIVKRHLIEAGILENRCSWCGISEWRGQPLSIQIDHINGVRDDNRIENLRMLCPNCHSQTETLSARNLKRLRLKSNG